MPDGDFELCDRDLLVILDGLQEGANPLSGPRALFPTLHLGRPASCGAGGTVGIWSARAVHPVVEAARDTLARARPLPWNAEVFPAHGHVRLAGGRADSCRGSLHPRRGRFGDGRRGSLMVLRPARKALGLQRGIKAVRWLFIRTAVVTLAVSPVFALLVIRTPRRVFITATYLFFAVSLLGFYFVLVSAPLAIGEISGMVYFVWFSVFTLPGPRVRSRSIRADSAATRAVRSVSCVSASATTAPPKRSRCTTRLISSPAVARSRSRRSTTRRFDAWPPADSASPASSAAKAAMTDGCPANTPTRSSTTGSITLTRTRTRHEEHGSHPGMVGVR